MANFDSASYASVADVATGKSVQVSKSRLLATFVSDLEFTADGKSLVTVLVPEGRGPVPTHGPNGIEDGPTVRMTNSRAVPAPVYYSLLQDPHDKALLKYYTTGQLAVIDIKAKLAKKIGAPAMIRSVEASHDGQYFTVTTMTEPFSYLLPVTSFGTVRELWDSNCAGQTFCVRTMPTAHVRVRAVSAWRNGAPAPWPASAGTVPNVIPAARMRSSSANAIAPLGRYACDAAGTPACRATPVLVAQRGEERRQPPRQLLLPARSFVSRALLPRSPQSHPLAPAKSTGTTSRPGPASQSKWRSSARVEGDQHSLHGHGTHAAVLGATPRVPTASAHSTNTSIARRRWPRPVPERSVVEKSD